MLRHVAFEGLLDLFLMVFLGFSTVIVAYIVHACMQVYSCACTRNKALYLSPGEIHFWVLILFFCCWFGCSKHSFGNQICDLGLSAEYHFISVCSSSLISPCFRFKISGMKWLHYFTVSFNIVELDIILDFIVWWYQQILLCNKTS